MQVNLVPSLHVVRRDGFARLHLHTLVLQLHLSVLSRLFKVTEAAKLRLLHGHGDDLSRVHFGGELQLKQTLPIGRAYVHPKVVVFSAKGVDGQWCRHHERVTVVVGNQRPASGVQHQPRTILQTKGGHRVRWFQEHPAAGQAHSDVLLVVDELHVLPGERVDVRSLGALDLQAADGFVGPDLDLEGRDPTHGVDHQRRHLPRVGGRDGREAERERARTGGF